MHRILCVVAILFATSAGAQTTNDDDSCDIGVTPAATLLLPYFEVDITPPAESARTTLFSVTNTSPQPQIARVMLWTDWAYPAFSFDLFLTGYGVASVNLRDLLTTGRLSQTGAGALSGALSASNYGNPNHLASMVSDCANRPPSIPPQMLDSLQHMFTSGSTGINTSCPVNGKRQFVGNAHANAIGYATIDVVATCSSLNPSDPSYFSKELLFDNVLIGDYQLINPSRVYGNYAGGTPLVHIRAIPEGGRAGSKVATNLPYTFYDRLTVGNRTIDRRQPLPSTFAARFIDGGGISDFATRFLIWREAYTGANVTCAEYARNGDMRFGPSRILHDTSDLAIVRFDEHENAAVAGDGGGISPSPPGERQGTTTTSALSTASSAYFPPSGGFTNDAAGWLYVNANNRGSAAYSAPRDFRTGSNTDPRFARQSQNWLVIEMSADGRYSTLSDAAALANGCSIAPSNTAPIQPGANVTP